MSGRSHGLTIMNRCRLIEFATTNRIPAMYEFAQFVRDGRLTSYGPDVEENFRQAAGYVDRILDGDLPVEQPTIYHLAVNLKAATTLGLAIPPFTAHPQRRRRPVGRRRREPEAQR